MKKSLIVILLLLFFKVCLMHAPQIVCAIDPPHTGQDVSNAMNCNSCHYEPLNPTPAWVTAPEIEDKGFFTRSCLACHTPENDSIRSFRYKDIQTHSTFQTSTTYGTWSVECIDCHDSHFQPQAKLFPTDPNSNIATGTVSFVNTFLGATSASITDTSANLLMDYNRYLLMPNTAHPERLYQIRQNSATTISVYGAINPNYVKPGDTYAIKYGKMIRSQVGPYSFSMADVKFFNNQGPNSFADSDTVVDGLCQVCHTRTNSFRYDGTLDGPGHPAGTAGTNCMRCHPHSRGFKAVSHE